MELQIQDLVSSIRKEGLEKAEQEKAAIIADANAKAAEIVSRAKEDARKLLEDAQKEIEVLKQSAEIGAKQALRDAELSFKGEVERQVKNILKADIAKQMDDSALASLISACISDKDVSNLKVEVAQVSEGLKAQLASQIKGGLELKPVKGINAGFRLAAKDGSGFFDCTDEEVSKMLAPFVGELKF